MVVTLAHIARARAAGHAGLASTEIVVRVGVAAGEATIVILAGDVASFGIHRRLRDEPGVGR
jgi:hypothetical protein